MRVCWKSIIMQGGSSLDIDKFVQMQLNERYKHFLIYGPPLYGKTKYAKYIAERYGGTYIDLLNEFCSDNEKKIIIDIFSPAKLIKFLESIESNSKIIVVDQMDFLINTWSDNDLRELLVFIDQNQSDKCFIFIMHNYRLLEKGNLIKNNDKGYSRQINMFDIKQGGLLDG